MIDAPSGAIGRAEQGRIGLINCLAQGLIKRGTRTVPPHPFFSTREFGPLNVEIEAFQNFNDRQHGLWCSVITRNDDNSFRHWSLLTIDYRAHPTRESLDDAKGREGEVGKEKTRKGDGHINLRPPFSIIVCLSYRGLDAAYARSNW